jgi:hypothetical protein
VLILAIVIIGILPFVPVKEEAPLQPVNQPGQPAQPRAYLTLLKSPSCWVSGMGYTYEEGQVFSFASFKGGLLDSCDPLFV